MGKGLLWKAGIQMSCRASVCSQVSGSFRDTLNAFRRQVIVRGGSKS